MFSPNNFPIKYISIKPSELPKLVISKTGINPIEVEAINEAPTTTTTSLGDGGKIFSVNAKRNKIT
jgi:hypothetical protein